MIIDYKSQDEMKRWASAMLGNIDFGTCSAIGIRKDGKLICVVVYNNFIISPKREPISIEMSIASIDRSWCNRHTLKVFFSYAFIQLKVKRIQATTTKKAKTTRAFLQRLGFKFEGVGRKAHHTGVDCTVYSMLKHECRYI